MATRSTINLKKEDGSYKSVYCHFDGDPDNMLPLLKNYDTYEKVDALIELGDMSYLDESIEAPEGHSFETPVKGFTVFYGRDRGEEDVEFEVCCIKSEIDQQKYNYIFNDGEWSYFMKK